MNKTSRYLLQYSKKHIGKNDESKKNILKFAKICKELNIRRNNNKKKINRMIIIIN